MKIAAGVLDALSVEQLDEARHCAENATTALRRKQHDVAADWWAAVAAAIVAPWGITTDVRADSIGLGSEIRYVAAMLDELRDHQNRPDPERDLWNDLLIALDDVASEPLVSTDLGGLMAELSGEPRVQRSGFAWTGDMQAAIAELNSEP